jgi:putative nucleotidyltransferase with HDIG domain
MPPDASLRSQYEEMLRRLASGVRGAQLYSPDHPLLARNVEGLIAALQPLHLHHPSVTVGIVADQLVVADTPLPKVSAGLKEFIAKLRAHELERIVFQRGVTAAEVVGFLQAMASLNKGAAAERDWSFGHIQVGRLTSEDSPTDGIAGDMAAIRRLYSSAVAGAEVAWESAATEGKPDLPAALQTVGGLADAIAQNRTALVALTAMRNYDNYTFTHMVNVSILTMGQARALGIEGRLLLEFGLSALMHDIGKVRTPKEILNKPDMLTEQEFAIMRRHVVDGAELLRRTPEMPILAPVIAFEHHLRLDGSGYPSKARRSALNLGTMLCSISDVYDAMRSQRAYQQAFPTERILAVLKRGDGKQFDQNLVRRFVQLLGVYPPGTLVKLTTGAIAVVTRIHAPDPYRPRVRMLFDGGGVRLDALTERNLWETSDSIAAPLDAKPYGIDPLDFISATQPGARTAPNPKSA